MWSNYFIEPIPESLRRSIASDCGSIITNILSETVTAKFETPEDKLNKLKTSIWNRIISNQEFERFNEFEYFRWLEIYKDANSNLTNVNPVSIEQKMALIEVINGRLIPKTLMDVKNISEDVQALGVYKLQKLQSIMSKFDLSSKITRGDLDDFSSDFMLILKGPPSQLLDYFTKSKTERMNERISRMVQEDMLLMGLKGMVARIPEKNGYTKVENFRYKVRHFFEAKGWRYLVLPYDLPSIDKVNIPDELLEKIMIDGLTAHEQELIGYLKKQNMIDYYERFRRIYRPVAFSLGFYFYYERMSNQREKSLNENQQAEKNVLIKDIEILAETVMDNTSVMVKTEDKLKEDQMNRMLQMYKKLHKKDPSAIEVEEIKSAIYR